LRSKIVIAFIAFLNSNIILSQRRYSEKGYEIVGLPDGDKIADSLIIGLPILLVGFLIAYFSMWSKEAQSKKEKNTSSNIGCIGVIIMIIGLFFLLPILLWLEFIFSSIYALGIGLFVVIFIIYGIYQLLNKK